jgi:hypothetical protein
MTDVWCFTCSHEIRREAGGGWVHVDYDDVDNRTCPCAADEEECHP